MRLLLLNQFVPPDASPTARLLGEVAAELEKQGHEVVLVGNRSDYRGKKTLLGSRPLRELAALAQLLVRGCLVKHCDVIVCLTSPPLLPVVGRLLALRHWRSRLIHWAMDLYPDVAVELGEIERDSRIHRETRRLMRKAYYACDLIIALDEDMAERIGARRVRKAVVAPWPPLFRCFGVSGVRCFSGSEKLKIQRTETTSTVSAHSRFSETPASDTLATETPASETLASETPASDTLASDTLATETPKNRRTETTASETSFRWLYSGNLGRAHEWRTLLEAQKILENDFFPFELVFQGGGTEIEAAQDYAEELELYQVHWLPYAPEEALVETLCAADCLIATQRPETQGCLWPSKIALASLLDRPILWVGPEQGSVWKWLGTEGHGCFRTGDAWGVAQHIQNLAERREGATASAEEIESRIEKVRRDGIERVAALVLSS